MSEQMIPFNKPFLTGKELTYLEAVLQQGKLAGNGPFTQKCQAWLEKRYRIGKCLLTASCTDALEMAAILLDIQPGDEVILPSYTFVSTANAFALRGASLVFADSRPDHPGMDESQLESLITPKTKALVPVHYAGIACNMAAIIAIAQKHQLFVVEDAAQALDAYFCPPGGEPQPLGGIGHLGTFSFHETKNAVAGEGGACLINHPAFHEAASIIWEKGTNRAAFFRGEVDKYNWIALGSSFLPSEMVAAFLFAQLEALDAIQQARKTVWETYRKGLESWAIQQGIALPRVPHYARHNAHTFYLVCATPGQAGNLIEHLKKHSIQAAFHHPGLHNSPYFQERYQGQPLPNVEKYAGCLVRLPLFVGVDAERVIESISSAL